MRNKSITLVTIALTLSVVMLFGFLVVFDQFGKSLGSDDSTDTIAATTTVKAETTTKPSSNVVTAFYLDDEGYGYRTIADVTYFFKKIENTTGTDSILTFTAEGMKPYGGYVVNLCYSRDGLIWTRCSDEYQDYSTGTESQHVFQKSIGSVGSVIYLSYCCVSNCDDPIETLTDLKNNVFSNPDMFYYYTGNSVG